MELKFNATIDITGGDLKKIVTDAIHMAVPGYTVTNVQFEVSNETRGGGLYNEPVFKCAKVSIAPKQESVEQAMRRLDRRGPG